MSLSEEKKNQNSLTTTHSLFRWAEQVEDKGETFTEIKEAWVPNKIANKAKKMDPKKGSDYAKKWIKKNIKTNEEEKR